jgi:HD superfamily phosphohydrolase
MAEVVDKKNRLINDLCTIKKTIDDFIYGTIQFSRFASEVIDSIEFQRLRNMRQLGVAHYVFPNAVHTRFEHSLGTYFQCKELTKRLADVTPQSEMTDYLKAIPELNEYLDKNYGAKKCEFDKYIQELVNIAALCHDLGHGPFSHLFDDIFIESEKELKENVNARHEKRSQLLIEIIIKKSPYLSSRISNEHIKLIQNIIDPPKNASGFIYQIVSNNSNSLDVDKFDYITRDMKMIGKNSSFDYERLITQAVITNNMIAYPKECLFNILQLFNMRHTMHREVYNHKGVVSAQLMMADIMKKINKLLNISESIKDMDKFCKFTDSLILQYPEYLDMCISNGTLILEDEAKKEIKKETKKENKKEIKKETKKEIKKENIDDDINLINSEINSEFDSEVKNEIVNDEIKNNSDENNDENLDKKKLINDIISLSTKLKTHNFYGYVAGFHWPNKIIINKDDIFKDEFVQYLDDIVIYKSVVGFVSGDKSNPLDNLYSYDYNDIKYTNEKVQYIGNPIQKNKHGITSLISSEHQEYLTMIYFKKNDENSKKNIIPKLKTQFDNYIKENIVQQYRL